MHVKGTPRPISDRVPIRVFAVRNSCIKRTGLVRNRDCQTWLTPDRPPDRTPGRVDPGSPARDESLGVRETLELVKKFPRKDV